MDKWVLHLTYPNILGFLVFLVCSVLLTYLFVQMVLIIALTAKVWDEKKLYELADFGEYGLAAGSIAMVFSLIGWSVHHFVDHEEDEKVQMGLKGLNLFLVAWNSIAYILMTFPASAPFRGVGNGYFASVALVVCAVMGLGVNASTVKSAAASGDAKVVALAAASLVEIIALAVYMENNEFWNEGDDEAAIIYGMVVACLTIVTCIGMVGYEKKTEIEVSAAIKLAKFGLYAVLWIILACLVTFRGPFEQVQNGYFGAWFGCIAAIACLIDAKKKFSGEDDED